MNTNKTIISMMLLSVAITPFIAFADNESSNTGERTEREDRGNRRSGKIAINFCTSLDTREIKKDTTFNDRMRELDMRRSDRAEKLVSLRNERDLKRGEKRDDWDTKRETKFKDLEIKATTTEQQAALAVYKVSVENAVTARKAAIDAAITTFRTGMDTLNAGHQTLVDAAKLAMNKVRTDAIATAKSDCAGGMDPKAAEAKFRATLEAARNANPAPKRAEKNPELKSQVQALILARKTAVQAAQATFKTAIDAARAELTKVIPAPVKK